MTYAVVVDVDAPVEMYDALHRDVVSSTQGAVDGLLLHIGRATATGFEVIEVWTDKDQFERYNREVVWPAGERLAQGQSGPPPQLRTEEFEVRGLVLPGVRLVQ